MKRYRWTAVRMSTTPRMYETEEIYVSAKDHDHEVEILKETITDLTHDYYAAVDRADRAEAEVKRLRKECALRRQYCKRLRAERDECRPYRDAVHNMHNGYNAEMRKKYGIKKPESPRAAILELIEEAVELIECEADMRGDGGEG